MTTPTPKQIYLPLPSVTLTAELTATQALVLKYEETPLSVHGNKVEINFPNSDDGRAMLPVTVQIAHIGEGASRWEVKANHEGIHWTPGTDGCSHPWNETPGHIQVNVTATNGSASSGTQPIFIRVKAQGSKPER